MSALDEGKNEQRVRVKGRELTIDLSEVDARRVIVVFLGGGHSPLDSGHHFVEFEGGGVRTLSLASNPPGSEYTVVILDPEQPTRPALVSHIQIREIRE
ncbi:MAG: hypothetical protein GVY11_01400 [Gammaproteobacteria bacterium]|jgi:hypothetical protein|nr:hypothetical protein [Gammaproteobacteria bacterium]